jgi:hypothetical protein
MEEGAIVVGAHLDIHEGRAGRESFRSLPAKAKGDTIWRRDLGEHPRSNVPITETELESD